MSMETLLARGQSNVAKTIALIGTPCNILGLTWDAVKKLWRPPYEIKATEVSCSIESIASFTDPDIATYIQSLNISFRQYRRITAPIGVVDIRADWRIVRVDGKGSYQVVEAVASDETSPLELVLHCKKI